MGSVPVGVSAPLLLVALLGLIPLWLRLRTLRRRRRWVLATLLGAYTLGVLALSGVHLSQRTSREALVYVVDRSQSGLRASDDALEGVALADGLRDADTLAGIVFFGRDAHIEAFPTDAPDFTQRRASVSGAGSDLESGLRTGLSLLPEGYAGRLVLISDGLATGGRAEAAAGYARERGVPIDVIPLDVLPAPELSLVEVRAPPTAARDEPVHVRTVVASTEPATTTLELRRDGEPVARRRVTFEEAGERVFILRDTPSAPGIVRYDARIVPDDAASDASEANNISAAFVDVAGAPRVLLIASEAGLAPAAFGDASSVDVLRPEGAPVRLTEWARYDLVVLDDVPARRFSDAQMRSLRAYVRDLGGGLLMAGARGSFGVGGWARTPLEDALPATFDLRERRDRLSLSMVIAIDRSGSMSAPVAGRGVKLDLANEGAAQSAAMLAPEDRIGILHVDTRPHWTQPMTIAADSAAIAAAARRAQPGGGGILVRTALRAAYGALDAERTQLKHVLLFSDGSDSAELEGTRAQVRQAASRGITTSIVSMGHGSDSPELEVLSGIGGGRFYIVEDLTHVPRIFTEETLTASQSAFSEDAFVPVRIDAGPVTRGLDFANAAVLGHAVVQARPSARVELGASEDEPSEAFVAWWRFGLGRSAVLTSGGAHLGAFGNAPAFGSMLDQLARLLRRETPQQGLVRLDVNDGEGRVVAEAATFPEGVVTTPAGRRVELQFTGASGRYEATFEAREPGAYWVTAIGGDGGGIVGSAGAMARSRAELRGDGTDFRALRAIAALSGGRVLENAEAVHDFQADEVVATQSLHAPLFVAALVLFFLSVVARRAPSWMFRGLRAAVPFKVEPAGRPADERPPPTRAPRPVDRAPFEDREAAHEAEVANEAAEAEEPESEALSLGEQLLKKRRR
ncbi:MAG: VWA domain-containing protein [Myxococcota bacterium]